MQETNNTQNQKNAPEAEGIRRAVPIIMFALAAFIALCYMTQNTGWLGAFISQVLLGLFACGAYAIPLLLVVHGVFFSRDIDNKCVASRAIFSAITVLAISALAYTIFTYRYNVAFSLSDFYRLGVEGRGGGAVGSTISFLLMKIFGSVGMIVIAVAIFALYISFFFAKSKRISGKFLYFLLAVLTGVLAFLEKCVMFVVNKIKGRKQRKRQEQIQIKNEEFYADDFFAVDNGLKELRIEELGIMEHRSNASIEANPTLHEKVFHKSAVDDVQESVHHADKVSEQSYTKPAERRKPTSFYDPKNTFIIETTEPKAEPVKEAVPEKPTTESAKINKMYGLDENAEDVFTSDFDPFDFVAAESLVNKPSSKAHLIRNERGIGNMEESISGISEEDIKRARELERFESRKRTILENARRTPTPVSAEPVSASAHSAYTETKSVEINFEKSEKVGVDQDNKPCSVTIDKIEAQMNRQNQSVAAQNTNNDLHISESAAKISESETYSHGGSYSENRGAYAPSSGVSTGYPAADVSAQAPHESNAAGESFAPASGSFAPASERFAPASESFTPASESFTPASGSFAPASESFTPASESFTPASESFTPASGSFAPASENFAPASESLGYSDTETNYEFDQPEQDGYGQVQSPDMSAVPESSGEFDIRYDYAEPAEAHEDSSELFAPIDYPDDEPSAADESELFKPYQEPSPDNIATTPTYSGEVLNTERSMLNADISADYTYESQYEEDDAASADEPYENEELSAADYTDAAEEAYTPEVIPEAERNPEVEKMREMFPFLNEDAPADEDTAAVEKDEDDAPPFEAEYTAPASVSKQQPKAAEPPKKEEPKKPDYSNFVLPPVDLLIKDDESGESNDDEIQENANKLIETLGSFNVTVSIKGYDRGPRITRYEVVPAAGVKVSQVTNLENDVALALAAGSLRVEAPIPGKSAIGFEIPNKHSETVRLGNLIETDEFLHSDKPTTICIGKDVAGFPVISSIEKMPHVLIAGATGMGKSVCINSLMVSMLYKSSPADIRFIMIDPKKVEFNMYEGIPHLLVPIVTDSKKAAGALMWAVEEMERRYDLIGKNSVRNIDAYNEIVARNPSAGEKLARIVIVIDEFADLMLQVRDPVENLVMSLAQKARAAGIHLIIGTQKPTTDVITGVIKSNIPARISCRVSSNVDSRIILDQSGAEKLLDKGDMLFSMPGMLKHLRVQGAFVSDAEILDIMTFLKQSVDGPVYDTEVLDQINKAAARCNKNSGGSNYDDDDEDDRSGKQRGFLNDRKFLEAVEIAVNTGSIATSKLQRKLSIGFGKAGQFIDVMEDLGIVGPANGPKAREVLMSADEWHEKLARTQLDD